MAVVLLPTVRNHNTITIIMTISGALRCTMTTLHVPEKDA
jgi:hypothetical protein